jgi:hypothetical protein
VHFLSTNQLPQTMQMGGLCSMMLYSSNELGGTINDSFFGGVKIKHAKKDFISLEKIEDGVNTTGRNKAMSSIDPPPETGELKTFS